MNINEYIDHTILKADAKCSDIKRVCEEARSYQFKSVCVNSTHVELVKQLLDGSNVLICCVVGFPLGAMATEVKAFEASYCAKHGATEIDMVINIGAAKEGNWVLVEHDISEVVKAARAEKASVKVIIETCLLTDEEKVEACNAAVRAGAEFVKTSTGFSTAGATPEDVALMRRTVGPDIGVKASGGVRTFEDANKMISSGASRLGTSNGVNLMKG